MSWWLRLLGISDRKPADQNQDFQPRPVGDVYRSIDEARAAKYDMTVEEYRAWLDEPDEIDASDSPTDWITLKTDCPYPEGADWITWQTWVEVAGAHHYPAAVAIILKNAISGKPIKVILERDPSNSYDANAIKVIFASPSFSPMHGGFIPKSDAAALAKYPDKMPLGACLKRVRYSGPQAYFKIAVLIPSKKQRVAKGWEPADA